MPINEHFERQFQRRIDKRNSFSQAFYFLTILSILYAGNINGYSFSDETAG